MGRPPGRPGGGLRRLEPSRFGPRLVGADRRGVPDVRILDGGLGAWTAAGGALETGTATAEPGDVTVSHEDLYAGARPTLTAEQAASRRLLDARAPERFRGEVEPVDPVAGHIPGAKNVPSTSMLADDGAFLR